MYLWPQSMLECHIITTLPQAHDTYKLSHKVTEKCFTFSKEGIAGSAFYIAAFVRVTLTLDGSRTPSRGRACKFMCKLSALFALRSCSILCKHDCHYKIYVPHLFASCAQARRGPCADMKATCRK